MRRIAEGRFSVNPPDDSGPEDTSEYALLQDIQHDLGIIDEVMPRLNALNPSRAKKKLLLAAKAFRAALETDAAEVAREFEKRYGRGMP